MFKTIDRYILKAFFTNYLIALSVMVGLYVVLDLFVNLDEFTAIKSDSRMQTIVKIVDFYSYNLFLYFAQLSGIILLVSACFTFGRFHRTNELTALLASGTSLYRVATPILLAALFMNGLWFVDQEVVLPRYADKLARKHADIEGRNSFAVWFQVDRNNALVSASMFHPRAKEMRGVIILLRDKNGHMTDVIRADRARWDEERLVWHLERGTRMKFTSETPEAAPADLGGQPVLEYASDLTPKELQLQQATQWTSFVSMPELDRLHERFAESGTGEFIKMKHRRLTTIIMNMIMLCIGLPFFLTRERASVVVVGGKCMLLCIICYVFTFLCQNVDLSMFGLSATLPNWLPVIIFSPVAVLLMDGIKT